MTVLIGLAPDADSAWTYIRVGEIKLLLALALGDDDAIREGCTWIAQYGQRSEGVSRFTAASPTSSSSTTPAPSSPRSR